MRQPLPPKVRRCRLYPPRLRAPADRSMSTSRQHSFVDDVYQGHTSVVEVSPGPATGT